MKYKKIICLDCSREIELNYLKKTPSFLLDELTGFIYSHGEHKLKFEGF